LIEISTTFEFRMTFALKGDDWNMYSRYCSRFAKSRTYLLSTRRFPLGCISILYILVYRGCRCGVFLSHNSQCPVTGVVNVENLHKMETHTYFNHHIRYSGNLDVFPACLVDLRNCYNCTIDATSYMDFNRPELLRAPPKWRYNPRNLRCCRKCTAHVLV
jgi:hypothetical protein